MKNETSNESVGHSLTCEEKINFANHSEAFAHYIIMRERLLDINNWQALTGAFSAKFEIINMDGSKVNRILREGDYIRIDIPGPGLPSTGGYDWVRAYEIEEELAYKKAQMIVRLQPSENPTQKGKNETAHFLKDMATSSLIIHLNDNAISIKYAGRKEIINLENECTLDNVRNFLVGMAIKTGINYPQWKSLIRAIINKT